MEKLMLLSKSIAIASKIALAKLVKARRDCHDTVEIQALQETYDYLQSAARKASLCNTWDELTIDD